MYYHVLENLLIEGKLKLAEQEDVEVLDKYLASLTSDQSSQISSWRVSKKTGISKKNILEVFLCSVPKGLLSVRYEIWHPENRQKIFETFNKDDLKNPIPIENYDEDEFIPREQDIHLSFRLNEVLNKDIKKKMFQKSLQKIQRIFRAS